jgi:hypothetical protein
MMAQPTLSNHLANDPTSDLTLAPRRVIDDQGRLLRDLRRRVRPVITVAAARMWPAAELNTLVRFLRETVLPRISAQQRLAHESDGSWGILEHAKEELLHLYRVAHELSQAGQPDPDALATVMDLIEGSLTSLERDLTRYQSLLAGGLPASDLSVLSRRTSAVSHRLAGVRGRMAMDSRPEVIVSSH